MWLHQRRKVRDGELYLPSEEASDTLTSTLAAFLFISHPRRERDGEVHLNYYASACNKER